MVVPLIKKWEHRFTSINAHIRTLINKESAQHADNPMDTDQTSPDSQKPVAYDADGKPLYAAPPESAEVQHPSSPSTPSQVVHVARATEPVPVEVSEETRKRHDESKKKFPWLNLSDHEYVISAVQRHSVGTWAPIAITTFAVAVVFTLMFA